MSQSNLEKIAVPPQTIATSTSHLQSRKVVESERRVPSVKGSHKNMMEESEIEKEESSIKVQVSELKPTHDQAWTLQNVCNANSERMS